jgi:hypothetical protein
MVFHVFVSLFSWEFRGTEDHFLPMHAAFPQDLQDQEDPRQEGEAK